MSRDTIPPFDYLKGSDFTHNLKDLTGCKDFMELSKLVGVPKSTFSTWNTHERTSHELMVRLSISLGIPLENLALKESDRQTNSFRVRNEINVSETSPLLTSDTSNPQHGTVILKSACLSDGRLIDTGEVPYALRRMNKYGLDNSSVVEIETNEALYLVNQDIKSAVSGKYLVDIDGHLSINHVQRLPGKKLAVAFGDTTMEVAEEDIKIVGRVAVVLETI
ncbi:phage repressor protein CI [Vibrio sp. IB15]|uniref:phage repressor protein CI n=1 Tax=Vibrio sp. IB15 TaxID=2779368 RepID=UPI0018E6E2B1|nr:phage repressor protein CI [Vibrio sp. IB15]MBJ2147571.1 phage repressor protein CI [Vibrio sp. IB15]